VQFWKQALLLLRLCACAMLPPVRSAAVPMKATAATAAKMLRRCFTGALQLPASLAPTLTVRQRADNWDKPAEWAM
jgi:hypothetical protein